MNNEPPKPEAWLLTRHKHRDFDECFYFELDEAMQDAELDSEDLPEGQFHHQPRPLYGEESLAELAALRERLKVAEKQRNEMKRVWDQTCKCGACQMRYEAISGEKYQAYRIVDAEERARVFGELLAERDQLKAEIERLRVREVPAVVG